MKIVSGALQAHCVRLSPGDDLVSCVKEATKQITASSGGTTTSNACCILSCVGSLDQVTIRMANASRKDCKEPTNDTRSWQERFEIVSLVGTLNGQGEFHLHLSVADSKGATYGGHLIEGRVFTTVELVLGTIDGASFDRVHDDATGYKELFIRSV